MAPDGPGLSEFLIKDQLPRQSSDGCRKLQGSGHPQRKGLLRKFQPQSAKEVQKVEWRPRENAPVS